MYQKIIRNDIRKSRLITAAITGFIMFAALFTSLGVTMLVNLLGSIDKLMLDARAPHYFQMYMGDVDFDRLERFAAEHSEIEAMQFAEFLNIEGSDITIGDYSLADSVQDNGIAVQNEQMDLLLDMDNEIIDPARGEIYVPIYYAAEGVARIGDTITIHDMTFTVAGFLRDSQMNAPLASSKRFLVNEDDYEQLKDRGKLEHLIQFQLLEGTDLSRFESDYINAGLEDNGLAATAGLVRMMNGINDGITIALLMLLGLMIIIVAFLCVRFTLISKVEEDYKEIGVLKAIGLRVSDIKKLYLVKYGAIAAAGCSLGFLLSFCFQKPMLKNIHLYMGKSQNEVLATLLGAGGAAVVFLIVILYVNGILRRFRNISATQAIRFGAPSDTSKASKGLSLIGNRMFSSAVFLGIKDVFSRKRLYLIMLLVLVISCFIIMVPLNINNTIADRSFMTYMGIGECDIRMDIQLRDDISQKAAEIDAQLSADPDVEDYSIMICRMFDMPLADGSLGKLRVELGDHSSFPLTYSQGREPRRENEISLSTLNGDELEKGIGDVIVLKVNGRERDFTVCGLYSDVTNGGRTAKAVFQADSEKAMWAKIPVLMKDTTKTDIKLAEYKEVFSYARVSKIDDYIEQTYGSTLKAIENVSYAAMAVSASLTVLITLLFMKMLVTKDRYQISVLKALGFSNRSIQTQYFVRAGMVLIFGLIAGTIAANTLGGYVGVVLMSSFGVTTFHLKIDVLSAYVVSPAVIAVCVYAATRAGISDIKNIKISEYIKE